MEVGKTINRSILRFIYYMNRKVTLLYISLACVLSVQAQTRQQMGGVYYAYPEGPSAKTGTFGTATYVMSDSLSVPQGYAPFISVITVVMVLVGCRRMTGMSGSASILKMRVILLHWVCR